MMGFLNFQCFCPDLHLSALTEWFRALPGAFPNRVFKSEEGYFSTMSLSMLENVGIILRDRRLPVAAPTTRAGEPSRSP